MSNSSLSKTLQPRILCKRLLSMVTQLSIGIIASIIIATILGDPETFGSFVIFSESAFITSILILLGQDRLLIILLTQFKTKTSSFNQYSHFLLIWTSICLVLLACSMSLFFLIPDKSIHPILLGICFSPYYSILCFAKNLLSSVNRPIIGRNIQSVALLLFALPLLYLYHQHVGSSSFLIVAYLVAFFYTLGGIVGISYAFHLLIKQNQSIETLSTTAKNNFFYHIGNGFLQSLALIKTIHTDKSNIKSWIKKGLPLGLARLSDNLFSLAIPLLALMGISKSLTAYAAVAGMLVYYNAELSEVIRNHFIPIILSNLPTNLEEPLTSQAQKNMRHIIRTIWALVLIFTSAIFLLAIPVLHLYGPSYVAAFPMVIVFALLMFLTYGWSFNRGILTLYPSLKSFFQWSQNCRFLCAIILLPLCIWLFGIYGAFIAIGVPSFVATASQIIYIYKKTGLSLLW
jgi:hypothetical protein